VLVAGLYILSTGKKKYIPYLLIPAAFFGFWCLHNIAVYGKAHFFEASSHVGKGLTVHKLISVPAFFSGCLVFPIFLFFRMDIREKLLVVILSAMLFVVAEKFIPSRSAQLYTVLIAATGIFVFQIVKYREEMNKFVLSGSSLRRSWFYPLNPGFPEGIYLSCFRPRS